MKEVKKSYGNFGERPQRRCGFLALSVLFCAVIVFLGSEVGKIGWLGEWGKRGGWSGCRVPSMQVCRSIH